MGENCFVEVQYSNWFLSLIARLRVVLVPGFKTFSLPSVRVVLPLDQNNSFIRVESNFVRAGFKNSFSVGINVVFFGVLRFLSSMRSVVSGTLQIETVFHVMLQHRTDTILLCMLATNESRLILFCCNRCFLWFKF